MLYISPSLVALAGSGGTDPLSRARIGYRTITRDATVTATSEAPGFPASAVRHPLTYERWAPTVAPAALTIDAGAPVAADYVGIAAHTIGTTGAAVTVSYSTDGTAWTDVLQTQPANDNAIMALFEPVLARYWRIRIDRVAEIGVIYIERALTVQRSMYGGHSPGTLSRQTEIEPSRSVTGQFLGRSIVRQGFATSYQWSNLTAAWYRANFDPFVESALRYPFFIAWRPDRFPNEVLYAWCNDDIEPTNMGVRDLMQVSFNVEAVK